MQLPAISRGETKTMANDYKDYHAPVEKTGNMTVYHPKYKAEQKEAEIAKLRELLRPEPWKDPNARYMPYAT